MNDVENPSKRQFLARVMFLSAGAMCSLAAWPKSASTGIQFSLEYKVRTYINDLRRVGKLPSDERTAWSVYDFTLQQKLLAINENAPLQSASMIKPFIALAFFFKMQEHDANFAFNDKHRAIMEDMLKNSSNTATNYFINLLSGRHGRPQEVERILKKNAPHIFADTTIIERIPANGRTYRNKASVRDYNRFLHALWQDQLPYSHELKEMMQLPNQDRIFSGASKVAPQTRVIDKTGTTARLCGDFGILIAKGKNDQDYPYTFIGIIEKAVRTEQYQKWVIERGDIIREVSNIVYTELQPIHNLV